MGMKGRVNRIYTLGQPRFTTIYSGAVGRSPKFSSRVLRCSNMRLATRRMPVVCKRSSGAPRFLATATVAGRAAQERASKTNRLTWASPSATLIDVAQFKPPVSNAEKPSAGADLPPIGR